MKSASKNATAEQTLNPKTKTYEWFGPPGAVNMLVSLPLLVLGINAMCGANSCSIFDITNIGTRIADEFNGALPALPWAIAVELLWLLFHCAFYLAPIGERIQGLTLRNGKTLTYNINAIHAFYFCHAVALAGHLLGFLNLGILADNFYALALASCLISSVMSIGLYIASFRPGTLCALGGNSGNMFYDMWVGRELNPRIGNLDLKFMLELRPGLIGWSLINWAYVCRAAQDGTWTPAIILVAIFESLYILDGLLIEAGVLTMMDIVTDGFGFMLCFGDLAWVPFLYTLKTRFLYYWPQYHGIPYLVFCTVVMLIGYLVFRGANTEKDRFRKDPRDPRVAHLKTLKTSAGKSLLISGYWGISRHPNYVGDWFMTLAESLLTGTSFAFPYFQPIYFGVLLIHRQLRDEESMLHKYGKEDWDKYCKLVPYRLIPYVY
eukprot:GILI01021233.1.p1 GENE.GILI01021233.1~~GILI01021233.1.p1  ORF type:complete len:435 (-),score=79.14 GILI01021233.1:236-1540(-)